MRIMNNTKTIFDPVKSREMIERGRRGSWWQRKGSKSRGFYFIDQSGKRLSSADQIERINALVIPPAWKHVRINPFPGGRIQAVGMDAAGRVQYLYHPTHTQKQGRKKYAKLERFGKLLPKLKAQTNADIETDGLPLQKVLAVALRLINSLYFRVGTDHSEVHYKTYGITTLHKKHLTIGRKGKLEFSFVGKSHIEHRKVLVDEELAAIIKELTSLGRGRKLFRYLNGDGKPHGIRPSHINAYIKQATDREFSSKDFRTWGGTLLAAVKLAELGPAENDKETKKNIVRAVKAVAEELGNTPAVCRSSYIHPAVLGAYSKGITLDEFKPNGKRPIKRISAELEPEEKALLRLLQSQS